MQRFMTIFGFLKGQQVAITQRATHNAKNYNALTVFLLHSFWTRVTGPNITRLWLLSYGFLAGCQSLD